MTIPIRLGTTAEAELVDAAHWYEERQPGLGQRFVSAVDATIHALTRWPRIGAPVEGVTSKGEMVRPSRDSRTTSATSSPTT